MTVFVFSTRRTRRVGQQILSVSQEKTDYHSLVTVISIVEVYFIALQNNSAYICCAHSSKEQSDFNAGYSSH